MFDSKNDKNIYHIVDEEFLNSFSAQHKDFMKSYYYSFYSTYCSSMNKKALTQELFYTNMRRHKLKLLQCFCPFCGHIDLSISNEPLSSMKNIKYCCKCGKKSVFENSMIHLSRFARIANTNQLMLNLLEKKSKTKTDILTFDMYHLEVIELTSIIEVTLRDFFNIFLLLKYENLIDEFLNKQIDRNTGNDFMNVLKANEHYKKALSINLKDLIPISHWNNLVDTSSIRNVLIHNNGFIDDKFKNSSSFKRYEKNVKGNMLFLNKDIIIHFVESITELMDILDNLYQEKYMYKVNNIIANYYFNNKNISNINN